MKNVFFEISNGNVLYYKMENDQKVYTKHEEYYHDQKRIAESMYDTVVKQAKKNGSIYNSWVQRHFHLDYMSSSMIIDRMRDENIIGAYDSSLGASKIIS